MKRLLRSRLTASILLLSALPAFGQGALLQGGPWSPGHVPQYVGQGSGQAVVQDGGSAGGGAAGVNPSEFGLTARGTGTPPYAGQGRGPLGTNFCDYDAPITNPAGYHFLCLSANAQGGALIASGAGGIAAELPLCFIVNGVPLCLGGGSTGTALVTATLPTTPPTVTCWVDAAGKLGNCSAGPATLFGNPGGATIAPGPFTIQGLAARGAPDANGDRIPVWDAAAGIIKYVTPGQIASAATAGVSSLGGMTGAITCADVIRCSAGSVGTAFTQAGTGAVPVSLDARMRDTDFTLEMFGGVADDVTKGTVNDVAFAQACIKIGTLSGATGSPASWFAPTLVLRGGHTYTITGGTVGIAMTGCRFIDAQGGNGYARISMDPASTATYFFDTTGSTRLGYSHLVFAGGKSVVLIDQPNIDEASYLFKGVQFFGQTARPVVLQNAFSSILRFTDVLWAGTNGGFSSEADVNIVDGASWAEPIWSNWTSSQGFFLVKKTALYDGQSLRLDNLTGVPDLFDGAVFHPGWWVDLQSAGRFVATGSRFGGEGAGIPIIYYSGQPAPSGVLFGGAVTVTGSSAACGPAGISFSGCIWLNGQAPMSINWTNNIGPSDDPIVSTGSINLTTYLSGWAATTSNPVGDIPKFWVWNIDTSNFRSSTALPYPVTATQIVRTPTIAGVHLLGNADYAGLYTDRVIQTSVALTAPRTAQLPLAASYPSNTPFVISDMIAAVSQTNFLAVAAAVSDTINGQATFTFNQPYSALILYSDGVSKWNYGVPSSRPFTVASLPTCNATLKGSKGFYVTDASAPTFLAAVSGGGAVVAPVFCNGTAWVAG